MAELHPLSPRRWFDSAIPVDRKSYLFSGLFLVAVKYAIEAAIVFAWTGRGWSPASFFVPIASMRAEAVGAATAGPLLTVLGVLTLPFLFVGLSMSVRRAANAGLSPFLGLGFVFPGFNYLTMLILAAAGERPLGPSPDRASPSSIVTASVVGMGSAIGFGLLSALAGLSEVFGPLGGALFFATPVLMGVVCGYILNRDVDRGLGRTALLTFSSGVSTMAALLLFGIEGMICILLIVPIAIPVIMIGGEIGRAIAKAGGATSQSLAFFFAVPIFAAFQPLAPSDESHHVTTSIEVDAPPDVVFDHVVSFPPIDAPRPWYFRTGIAVPLRARIDGTGVGAVRHCEFTTGSFVEPITAWEPGRRLAFDVISSPPPMEEWSPYRIHPRHLATTMRSRRGEFRLTALPGGRTRLEGRTEYYLGIAPDAYFAPMADEVLHRIHLRVLTHVARQAERDERVVRRTGG